MQCDSERVGVVLSFQNNVSSPLPSVGLVFDGIVCSERSVCTLSGRRCDSRGQYEERGAVSI